MSMKQTYLLPHLKKGFNDVNMKNTSNRNIAYLITPFAAPREHSKNISPPSLPPPSLPPSPYEP